VALDNMRWARNQRNVCMSAFFLVLTMMLWRMHQDKLHTAKMLLARSAD
jgi:hypothetical protein